MTHDYDYMVNNTKLVAFLKSFTLSHSLTESQ